MKHFPILRLLAFGVVLLTAMAFSCEDHNIPDPVTNCNRVDGTPRAFDCEFEFVKALVYNIGYFKDTIVYGVATPEKPDVEIKEEYYGEWLVSSISGFHSTSVQMKVTIKRIAPPPSPTAINYLIRRNLTINPDDNLLEYFPFFISPDSLNLTHQKIDIPVGATHTFDTFYFFGGYDNIFSSYNGSINLLPIQNKETTDILTQAPYNYTLFRDIAETSAYFRPKFVPHPYL